MEYRGIQDKVRFLLSVAQRGSYSREEYEDMIGMVAEHSEHMRLGRVFGYSVSDYALATLKWLGTDESLRDFDLLMEQLSVERQNEVNRVIEEKAYLEY